MVRRVRKSYISGHCASTARGGHDRCRVVVTETVTCRCACHFDQLGIEPTGSFEPEVEDNSLEDDSEVNEQPLEELVDVS